MDISVRKETYKVFIYMVKEGASFSDWSPIQLTKCVHKEMGEVMSAKKLRNGSLLVECIDEEQQKKSVKISKMNGQGVRCVIACDKELIRGVITGIPVKDSVEELLGNIKNVKKEEAKRMKMKRDGVLSDSLSILLRLMKTDSLRRYLLGS